MTASQIPILVPPLSSIHQIDEWLPGEDSETGNNTIYIRASDLKIGVLRSISWASRCDIIETRPGAPTMANTAVGELTMDRELCSSAAGPTALLPPELSVSGVTILQDPPGASPALPSSPALWLQIRIVRNSGKLLDYWEICESGNVRRC